MLLASRSSTIHSGRKRNLRSFSYTTTTWRYCLWYGDKRETKRVFCIRLPVFTPTLCWWQARASNGTWMTSNKPWLILGAACPRLGYSSLQGLLKRSLWSWQRKQRNLLFTRRKLSTQGSPQRTPFIDNKKRRIIWRHSAFPRLIHSAQGHKQNAIAITHVWFHAYIYLKNRQARTTACLNPWWTPYLWYLWMW